MAEIGTAYVTLLPSAKGFGNAVQGELTTSASKAGTTASKGFKGTFVKGLAGLGGVLGGVFAVSKITEFGRASVDAASDLAESQSKTQVVFGKSADVVLSASKKSANAMGLSQQAYLENTATLGNLLTALDLAPDKAAGMSQDMVRLAGDLASFNNVNPEEALLALRAGLTGEAEPLKRFGVNMNEATLKAEALRKGLIKNDKEALTPQQKSLAAYSLIMKQTGTAQGDFKRTSGGLANQQRILGARLDNLKAAIGQRLIPVVLNVVKKFSRFINQMQTGRGAGGKFRDVIEDIKGALDKVWPILQDVGKWMLDNAPIIYGVVAAFAAWRLGLLLFNAVQAIQLAMLMIVTPGTFLYAVASGVAAAATAVWAAAVWLLTTPLGLLVLGIIALIVVIVLVIKYHRQIGAFIAKTWEKIKAKVSAAVAATVAWVRARWNSLIGWLGGIGARVGGALANLWEGVKRKTSEFKAWIAQKIGEVVRFILDLPSKIASLGARLLSVGKSVGGALIRGFFSGMEAVGGFVSDLAGSVKSAINSALHLPVTIHGPGPLPDFSIPAFATGGRVKGSYFLAGERGWESIIPDNLMVEALTAAASAGAGQAPAGPRVDRLRLVVDGYEFNAYVDARADSRVASQADLDDQRGRAAWRQRP